MKKTRLLEIIREEITGALGEASYAGKGAITQMKKDPKFTTLSGDGKLNAEKELKSGGTVELEEDQLDEMAYNIVLSDPAELARLKDKIKDSTKKGEQLLYQVIDIIQRDKKEDKPIRQRDIANELGTIQQKINPLVNLLIDYGILTKGESVTGVTKKTVTDKPQGRKPNPNKPEKTPSTGKRGRPAASTSAGKEVTLTPGDDGFDDVSYNEPAKSSDEDKAAAAAAKADKAIGGKYAASLTPEEEDLFKTYKRQAITLANKIEDAESSAEKQRLMGQLKSLRNDPEVARLFKAKGVNV